MISKSNRSIINIISLGCSKNLVDSEVIMRQLQANGLTVLHNDDSFRSGTVIINTCGFINDAKEESIQTILKYVEAKKNGKLQNLYVIGCLAQRYLEALSHEIPEVNKYFGVNKLEDIITSIGLTYKQELTGERYLTTPKHYAYLKISEGCDRKCSFCAIPLIRGKHHSRSLEDLMNEARFLVKLGVKELILIAQDLTYYGTDLTGKKDLGLLLQNLSDIEELEWIRLHYTYPARFPLEVLKLMRERTNICNYIDIPFQHINDKVLKNMRRGIDRLETYELIRKIRQEVPGVTLRTTLITGHPGEGKKEFNELFEFVEKTRFDRLGVFRYSEEEDTFAAKHFPDVVEEDEKQDRTNRIMELQRSISLELNRQRIGSTIKVLVDRKEDDIYFARTEGDSPEVDNEVMIRTSGTLEIGKFYPVRIVDAYDYDLLAEF